MSAPVDLTPPQAPDITPDELLMRRLLLVKKNKSYLASATPPVREGAFQPRKGEEALSVSRRYEPARPAFLTEWQFKMACRYGDVEIANACGVCAVPAGFASDIGLEIRPDPIIPDDPGHAVLPGINWNEWNEDTGTTESRGRIRLWISELIDESSRRILIAPGTPRSENPEPPSDETPTGQPPQSS